ncbi:MAG TPA: DNA topoisomerase 3 [Bryobacteraceae bacterium]|nr:DNA topoisomerase 3 [Bryobacteraceae bacterium]
MKAPDSGGIAVLAEKPSVARDIARVLGATKQGDGYLHGNGHIVTWAVGHLAALAQPHEIKPDWKHWRRDLLPMLPAEWPLVVYEKTKDQFQTVQRILTSPKVSRVVCATDAGREGELIFRYIYEAAHCDKPVSRLWISSLTPEAIRKGLDSLRPGSDYDPLADAARGRSRADWLVGMNLSRAYSLTYGGSELLSIGRVQTPTLAMLVERELAIRAFVPEDYLEVVATFQPVAKADQKYKGTWFRKKPDETRLPFDGEEAKQIVARAKTGTAAVESVKFETQRMAPPALYDLTELQRHANRLFGFSAQKTLDLAQALYEKHKLLSYPRTDSRHLSQDVAATLPRIVQVIQEPYREHLAPGTGERPLGKRFVDDSKVTDHHAIIPTTTPPDKANPSPDERKIYDLVCRRLLSAWHDDHIWSVTTVITAIINPGIVDRYHTSGTAVKQVGWKVLDLAPPAKKKDTEAPAQVLPPDLKEGDAVNVLDVEALKKRTRPPKRFTEATLLTAMETAGQTLDDKELSDAMKENGLGTPATRAAIIEVLLKREYIVRNGKSLEATDKGIRLIEVVHPEVKSPAMTGQWEAFLKRIERGKAQLAPFIHGIEDYVREVVGKVGSAPAAAHSSEPRPPEPSAPAPRHQTDHTGKTPLELLHEAFGFKEFRPNQEAVCQSAMAGQDVLLVMPTGSGKSLCYQLPGIARGGTTLVISPLIALMEDQVAKLKAGGFAVERIHSGRERGASRQACIDYLNGKLQFLFIAPERLRVSGFPEMLAKRKPTLIAIDEAHCISQWGHDFRPDYRMIGQYLPTFRPAPVIALTATATPLVQDDIAAQLGLHDSMRFIHGFRRDNIAIEVVEIAPSSRGELVAELLSEDDSRPAIVYTPTRKQAEDLAAELAAYFPSAAYHAGLDASRRKQVQEDFLSEKTQVTVATIAFGMGIDKPNIRTVIHTALPGSLEAYYQEVGRAGRDGLPSRAVLMHSYADRYTHDFFFQRDYPDPTILDLIFQRLGPDSLPKAVLQRHLRLDSDVFDKALEKLWIHGGAVLDFAENASRGHGHWRESYIAQAEQKQAQIDQIIRFAESNQCRMSSLVRHFGDWSDSRNECGVCDFCAPQSCTAQRFRSATKDEREALFKVVAALRPNGSKSTGKLHEELYSDGRLSRDEFEEVLGAMARAGLAKLMDAVFEKGGKQIPYRKVSLTREGSALTEESPIDFVMKETAAAFGKKKRKKRKTPSVSSAAPKAAAKSKTSPPPHIDARLEEALRAFRLAEARRRGVPAFRIFTDKVLTAMAQTRPTSTRELLAIPGIGLSTVEKYGAQIFHILSS